MPLARRGWHRADRGRAGREVGGLAGQRRGDPVRIYVGLGSNQGRPLERLAEALARMGDAGLRPAAVSPVYETEPQGLREQPWFVNCVAAVDTTLPPEEVLDRLQAIETAMGRVRQVRWGPRTLDLDLLLYGAERIHSPRLVVPHPRLHERAFALVPLADLDPDLVLPGHGPVSDLASTRRAESGQGLRPAAALPGFAAGSPTRERLLARLRASQGRPLSGEALARELGISRSAVWKHIQKMRAGGFAVAGSAGTGYRFEMGEDRGPAPLAAADLVSPARGVVGRVLHVLRTVDSTNRVARELGLAGTPDGTTVLAEEQTAGRGRRGRSFASPRGGVYLSTVLRPALAPAEAGRLTLAASLAVCRTLEVLGLEPRIKWPNDVLLPAGKVCGILLEMVAREDAVDFVVVGIGLNVHHAPPGVGATAVWDSGPRVPRVQVARSLLEELDRVYGRLLAGGWSEELGAWRARCGTLGSQVRISLGEGRVLEGVAREVTTDGALMVATEGGMQLVYAGDVTHLRPGAGAQGGES